MTPKPLDIPEAAATVQMIMTFAPHSGDDGLKWRPTGCFPPRRMASESSIVSLSPCNQPVMILRVKQLKFLLPCLETGALLPW
jgi:hypothetical protein